MGDKKNAEFWINHLNLEQPHPEGGFFGETVRSPEKLPRDFIPNAPAIERNLYTHIYYLLRRQDISAVHRLVFPERWHYYAGDAMQLYILENDESVRKIRLINEGKNPVVHFEVPAHTWMWAKPETGRHGFSLIGCSMTPGFHEEDWEMASKKEITRVHPGLEKTWEQFCIR